MQSSKEKKPTKDISAFMKNTKNYSSEERDPGEAQSLCNKDEEMHTSRSQNCSTETRNK